MIAQPVFAEEHSGSIGDIIWSISDDGVLKVSGTGAMPDYTSSTFSDAPWYAYESLITGIIIDSGVTHIGDYCFYNENNGFYKELTSVEILDAETIGECAFALCDQLENITFKGNAPQIAADAFSDVTANAYYIGACESWTEEKLANYGGTLTWNSVECSHVYSSVVTEPTCTEDGFTTYTCSVCGDNYVDDTVEKLGHSYQDVVTEPTCLEDGFTTHTCSRCEDSYIDSYVDKLGHDYVGVETPATCTEDGFSTYTCTRCEDSYIADYVDASGHSYDAVVTEPTCLEDGYTTFTCIYCEDSYIGSFVEATGHSYESVITAPTCLEQGYTTHICSRCEDSYVDNYTEPTGHSYEAVVTEATCLEGGYTTYICSGCSDSYVAEQTEALGHNYELVTTEATCTEPGYTDNVCTRCGDTVHIGFISPTGHSWYYASTVEPTCTKEGITIYCCANCDATNEEPIPMLSSCPTQGYSDVPGVSNWAHEGIDFCITRGIMGSTSTARLVFEPGISCTRSMIVSILYRLSGEPDVTFEAAFPDVKAGQWYSNAVIWAYHNGVVRGYDTGKFGPNDIITREQMAVILKGYTENILQQDTSASTTLNSFADCAKVKWSKDYVSWAVAVGMISGKTQQDGTVLLDPQGNASRSEVASILMRFVQNLVEA